ncbi:MAG: hypothetical protein K8U03_09185 [Planctomycetia bacterium]|nr:hypothetical protein [Planctomycetia bacterium]
MTAEELQALATELRASSELVRQMSRVRERGVSVILIVVNGDQAEFVAPDFDEVTLLTILWNLSGRLSKANLARRYAMMTDDELHERRAHPDFEYEIRECGRKQNFDGFPEMYAAGWEDNIYGNDPHSCWDRGDYSESHYFRRRKKPASEDRGNEQAP